MSVLGRVAAIAIGVVFVVAGAGKVARGREWPVQARSLGVHPVLAHVVPWWEMSVGALLVVGLLAPWAALAAIGTLLVFTGLIVALLRRGQHPPCSCFGAWSAAPLGVRHVWRNVAFAVVAVVAAVAG